MSNYSTTITPVNNKGGVVNGDFALQPSFTAETITVGRWIDGTAGGSLTDLGYGLAIGAVTSGGSVSAYLSNDDNSLNIATTGTNSAISVDDQITTVSPSYTRYIPALPNTAYKLTFDMSTTYTSGDSAGGAYFNLGQYGATGTALVNTPSTKVKTTTGLTSYEISVTTNASTAYFLLSRRVVGNTGTATLIMGAKFKNVKLKQVTSLTNPGSFPALLYPTVTAVTSTDNIDNNLDYGGSYINAYIVPIVIDEGATNRKTFTPTKKRITKVGIWIVTKGTGNWSLTLHDSGNNAITSATVNNANLVNGQMNYFNVPTPWTSGTYHYHLTSTVVDGTVKANTLNDLETSSFVQMYGKTFFNSTISTNGETYSKTTDIDGLMGGTTIDTYTGNYTYEATEYLIGSQGSNVQYFSDIYKPAIGAFFYANGLSISTLNNNTVFKYNFIYPTTFVNFIVKMSIAATGSAKIQWSTDNTNWNEWRTFVEADSGGFVNLYTSFSQSTVFYVRLVAISSNVYLRYQKLTTTINTNEIIPLTLKPGVNIINSASNGPLVADPTVDSSLQMIFGGSIVKKTKGNFLNFF